MQLIRHHMTPLPEDLRILRRRLNKFGPEGTANLLALQKADHAGKGFPVDYTCFKEVEAMLAQLLQAENCFCLKDLAVNGQDLLTLGFAPGKPLGACLEGLLEQVLDGKLPNEKQALLEAATRFLQSST